MAAPATVPPLTRAGRRSAWRAALVGWLGSRVVLVVAVLLFARLADVGPERHPLAAGSWVLDRFAYWDSYHFVRIAEQGYLPPGLPCCDQAFFPGYPGLMVALRPLLGGSTIAAGIVVTLVAGVLAARFLWLWVLDQTADLRVANRAVLALSTAPFGVFLVAVYTEASFLALAVAAWWAGGRRRWWLAGLLAAGASAVRVNGLFLAFGLAVMYAVQLASERRCRPGADVLALALPAVPVAAFLAYLHHRTGSWLEWHNAESRGWSRATAPPWTGLSDAVDALRHAPGDLVWSRALDVVVVVAGVVVVVLLLALRRWAEAAYLAPSVGVIACSTLWVSAGRYALTWFPIYLLLAQLLTHRRWRPVGWALVTACVVVAGVATWLFATRTWIA